MRFALVLPAAALVLTASCASKPRQPPRAWFPQPQQQAPNYGLPWAAPAGAAATAATTASVAPTATAPAAPASTEEKARCLSDAGTADDCRAALGKMAKEPGPGAPYDVYKRACEKKAKLLGCGAFKSTAITDADRPNMELLMLCESGAATACEDVKTKTAPLQAWLSTLKTDLCKKGESALCADFHQCKKPAKWTCSAVTGMGTTERQACGCQPPCAGTLTVSATTRSWPDGSTRAGYQCAEAKP
jgi:hypothetical protein